MDSWIYPAVDRLAALGLVPSQISGLRPWTRVECRRQMEEAERILERRPEARGSQAQGLLVELHKEFDRDADDTSAVTLESVYLRNDAIAGPPLNDSYHFGQTWSGDFGRPFGRGWNSYSGLSARVESGRFFAWARGEFQHAPGAEPYSQPTRQLLGQLDSVPTPAAFRNPDVDRFRPLEAYAGVRLGGFEISVGKQSLFWGPGVEAPLSFSSNAEPTKNLKISTIAPITLPGVLRHLGAMRGEFVIGKLGGHTNTGRPWFNAQKLSFKLTQNLEVSFTRWSIFWGVGHPITLGSFVRNFTSVNSPAVNSFTDANDPGDRKAGFDFRYRLPRLRNWVTIYCDSYSEDDPSPLAAPRRAAMSPGIWFVKVPGITRLDARFDVASTMPFGGELVQGPGGGQFNYYNAQYRSGNTNYGFLLGNPVGRDGRAVKAHITYSLSPRSKVEATYRQQKTSGVFLPGGGTQSDAGVRVSAKAGRNWYATAVVQYERFWIPALGGPQRNLRGSLQLTWEPHLTAALFRQ